MNNKEEAAHAWAKESDKRHGYINPALAYSEGISDFKAALIQTFKKESKIRDDGIFLINEIIEKINETKP